MGRADQSWAAAINGKEASVAPIRQDGATIGIPWPHSDMIME